MITPKDDALFLSKIFKDSKLIIIKNADIFHQWKNHYLHINI